MAVYERRPVTHLSAEVRHSIKKKDRLTSALGKRQEERAFAEPYQFTFSPRVSMWVKFQ